MKVFIAAVLIVSLWNGFAGEESYNFFMISDTHFGSAESFGSKPRTRKKIHRADQAMPYYRTLFADMAEKSDEKTRFLSEAGDLVEGLAYSLDAHKKELKSAMDLLKKYFKCPVYMVKGNHEAMGQFGAEAYRDVLLPEISNYAGNKLSVANYTVSCGKDLFIFVDYSSRWTDYVKSVLGTLTAKPRYLFLVIHLNVIPWCSPELVEMCRILSEYHGIILCGHTHRTMMLKYERDGKSVTQFTVNTYLQPARSRMKYAGVSEDLSGFIAAFRKFRVKKGAQSAMFEKEWLPWLALYREWTSFNPKYPAAGYARFHVSDQGIQVTVQSGDLAQAPYRFQLLNRLSAAQNRKPQ